MNTPAVHNPLRPATCLLLNSRPGRDERGIVETPGTVLGVSFCTRCGEFWDFENRPRSLRGVDWFMQWRRVETEAGVVCLAFGENGLLELALPGEDEPGCGYLAVSGDDPQWVRGLAVDLQDYFAGKTVAFSCPVDYSGYAPFFAQVLKACAAIPYGERRNYRWLAQQAGSPRAVRAAGQAMANNRTVLVVPCHRVLRSDGTLGGFSSGLHWKERLLALEESRGGRHEHTD